MVAVTQFWSKWSNFLGVLDFIDPKQNDQRYFFLLYPTLRPMSRTAEKSEEEKLSKNKFGPTSVKFNADTKYH